MSMKSALAVYGLALVFAAKPTSAERLYDFQKPQLGTIVKITLLAENECAARESAERAFAKIASLERLLTDYDASSEVRRLTATGSSAYERAVPVSQPLFEVLDAAQQISQRTEGAFDVTVGPLVRLWRRSARTKEAPSEQRLREALLSVGYRHLELSNYNERGHTAHLVRQNMRIDLGGIAKGYIADQALAALRASGHCVAMVDAGGDLALGDPPSGQRGWRIGVAPRGQDAPVPGDTESDDPTLPEFVELANCGVATSGDAARGFEIDGVRLSHVVDPRTGHALREPWAATVIAPTCMLADAYASAAMVLGPAIKACVDPRVKVILSRDGTPKSQRDAGNLQPHDVD